MSSKKDLINEQETAVNSLASMTKVMLYISCENLRTKSDTVAQVILDDRVAGSTEVCRLTDSPVYKTPITVQYIFEKRQKLRVDIVHGQVAYRREIPIGRFESDLAAVILGPGSKLTGSLGKDSGRITIRAVEAAKKGGIFRDDQTDLTGTSSLSLTQSAGTGSATGSGGASGDEVESLVGHDFAITEEFGELDEVRKFDNTFIEASARRLKEMNIFGRSDPFLVVSTKIDGELVEVFQTEIVPNTTKPQWPLVKIRSNRLYDSSCKFVVKVYSRNRLRKNSLIGAAKVENIFLVNENETKTTKIVIKDRNKDNENSGIVIFTVTRRSYERSKHIVIPYHLVSNTPLTQDQKEYPKIPKTASFLAAMRSGMEIQTVCAIDLTGSNGTKHEIGDDLNPVKKKKTTNNTLTSSLLPSFLMCTQYEKCISEVMPILEQYDSDKKVEFLGYGAEVDGNFPPYFAISQYSPECYGADGMLSAYRDNMHRFKPGDMSQARGGDKEWRAHNHRYYCDDFYQIVNYVCDITEKEMREEAPPGSGRFPPRYFILVVILDGDSFDTEGTRRALIRASALPVSIVLLGIGDSYFPNLVAYDADKQPMQTSERVSAMRDCVQFVRFNDFVAEEGKVNKRKLSDEILKEIPGQVESFLGMYGIRFNGDACVRKDKKHRDRRHKYFATSLANQENDAKSLKILESKQKYREERKKEKEIKALEKKKRELERKEKIDNIMSAAAAQNASDVPAKK